MKVLYVHGSSKIDGIINAMRKLRVCFEVYGRRLTDVFLNEKEMEELVIYSKSHDITHIMSIHLIDTLAFAAKKAGIDYIALIWDAPYNKVLTRMGKMENCWYSTFDRIDADRFQACGVPHVLYQPLAVDYEAMQEWNRNLYQETARKYDHEICFVGRLYENNFYDEYCTNLPPMLQDYFLDIFEKASFHWDGVNRIRGTVSNELVSYIREVTPGFEMINPFDISDAMYFENGYVIRKIANIERVCVLNMLAERYPVTFYTTSKTAERDLCNVNIMSPVCSAMDLHRVYQNSKISLNISLKGIEGGTPQRVLDILGAAGFVMTNYCPETAEIFEEDKEIVMFRTPEELAEKADYYLTHDAEREKIARNGYEKVMRCYTYERKIKELLDWVEGEEA